MKSVLILTFLLGSFLASAQKIDPTEAPAATETTEPTETPKAPFFDLDSKIENNTTNIELTIDDGDSTSFKFFSAKKPEAENPDQKNAKFELVESGTLEAGKSIQINGIIIAERFLDMVSKAYENEKKSEGDESEDEGESESSDEALTLEILANLLKTHDDNDHEIENFSQILLNKDEQSPGLLQLIYRKESVEENAQNFAYVSVGEDQYIKLSDLLGAYTLDLDKNKLNLLRSTTFHLLTELEDLTDADDDKDLVHAICTSECTFDKDNNFGDVLVSLASIKAKNIEEKSKAYCLLQEFNKFCPSEAVTLKLSKYSFEADEKPTCEEPEAEPTEEPDPEDPEEKDPDENDPDDEDKLKIVVTRIEVDKSDDKARYEAELEGPGSEEAEGEFKWVCSKNKKDCNGDGKEEPFYHLKRTKTYSVTVSFESDGETLAEETFSPNIDCAKEEGAGCTLDEREEDEANPVDEDDDYYAGNDVADPLYDYDGAFNQAPAPFSPIMLPPSEFGGTFMTGMA
ncbi:MAG: hypothetical protein ACPGJV_09465 [Bacteriovoracaceae bacterium]